MNETGRKQVTLDDIERRLVIDHQKPYYNWLRQVVTLAVAALTALVSLQGHYVPEEPKWVLLLAFGWVALAVTIVSGLFALTSEYETPLAAVKKLRKMRATKGDAVTSEEINRNNLGMLPHKSHKWAVRIMVASFAVSLATICLFAVLNLAAANPSIGPKGTGKPELETHVER